MMLKNKERKKRSRRYESASSQRCHRINKEKKVTALTSKSCHACVVFIFVGVENCDRKWQTLVEGAVNGRGARKLMRKGDVYC